MKQLFTVISIVCFCCYAVGQNKGDVSKDSIVINKNSKLLVIDAFDVMSLKERKNKKELFSDLTDSVVKWIADDYRSKGEEVIVLNAINYTGNFDSTVAALLHQNGANFAIVITFLNAWFDLTHVDVEKDYLDKSKSKTAFFDICSTISCKLYNDRGFLGKSDADMRRYFTSRATMGSLLSFGPDIVGKRKHVIRIMYDNTMKLLAEL